MVATDRFGNLAPIFLTVAAMARPEETRIQLCGQLVVQLGGRRIEDTLPGANERLLFAYLVLNRLRRMDRDELLTAVYGEEAPPDHKPRLSVLLDETATAAIVPTINRLAAHVCDLVTKRPSPTVAGSEAHATPIASATPKPYANATQRARSGERSGGSRGHAWPLRCMESRSLLCR